MSKLFSNLLRAPWLRALACLLLGVAIGHFGPGLNTSGADAEDGFAVVNPFASCPDKLSAAERERRVLREELAYTKQSVLIEQEACFELRESLTRQEDELGKLNEQLAFYRGIVSPEQDEAGVRIHQLELFDLGRGAVQFRLTLMQSVRQVQEAQGRLDLVIEGLDGDIYTKRSVQQLELSGDYTGDYAFRYYLEMHGQFRLPKAFKPLRIVTQAIPDKNGRKPVRQTFIWQEVFAAQTAGASK